MKSINTLCISLELITMKEQTPLKLFCRERTARCKSHQNGELEQPRQLWQVLVTWAVNKFLHQSFISSVKGDNACLCVSHSCCGKQGTHQKTLKSGKELQNSSSSFTYFFESLLQWRDQIEFCQYFHLNNMFYKSFATLHEETAFHHLITLVVKFCHWIPLANSERKKKIFIVLNYSVKTLYSQSFDIVFILSVFWYCNEYQKWQLWVIYSSFFKFLKNI